MTGQMPVRGRGSQRQLYRISLLSTLTFMPGGEQIIDRASGIRVQKNKMWLLAKKISGKATPKDQEFENNLSRNKSTVKYFKREF